MAIRFAMCGVVLQLACHAQSITSDSSKSSFFSRTGASSLDRAASELLASASAEQPADPSTAADATTSTQSASTPNPATAVTTTANNDEVIKELAEMKARIALLESELKANREAGADRDARALRAAETTDASSSAAPLGQAATPPPPVAAPAPPEISAERLTKEAPFPGDWTWLNSAGHNVDSPMATKYFTPEFRADANYILDYNHPGDDTMGGATESFRSDEWQLEQVSIGGDIRIDNVRGRILTMDGLFATTTPRNDGSPNRGQWDLAGAYKYISEGWGGYHWDVNHGLNIDAGIFVSYIGLFSYYNFDNWTYQPSFVSSNTPWFFNGLRIQWFPTKNLKIEPWIINGWQSYARYNGHGGLGGQILWRPKPFLDFVFNNYGLGEDDAGYPGRSRIHADYSAQVKYYDKPKAFLDKMAFTVTGDAGCEYGGGPASFATANGAINPHGYSPVDGTTDTYNGGVNCHNSKNGRPKQAFLGWMMYDRLWFKKDLYAITLGGGQMNNPGRYLTLLPPINGATAISGTPYYTENAGDRSEMHDGTITFDYMPSQFITFTLEEGYRYSDTPYWTGKRGGMGGSGTGITPPLGNNGSPQYYACLNGGSSNLGYGTPLTQVNTACGGSGTWTSMTAANNAIWWPDLATNQTSTTFAIKVRF
ncbi:MAG: outer membrane beta-barrel protein [Terracidiphilus sp.]